MLQQGIVSFRFGYPATAVCLKSPVFRQQLIVDRQRFLEYGYLPIAICQVFLSYRVIPLLKCVGPLGICFLFLEKRKDAQPGNGQHPYPENNPTDSPGPLFLLAAEAAQAHQFAFARLPKSHTVFSFFHQCQINGVERCSQVVRVEIKHLVVQNAVGALAGRIRFAKGFLHQRGQGVVTQTDLSPGIAEQVEVFATADDPVHLLLAVIVENPDVFQRAAVGRTQGGGVVVEQVQQQAGGNRLRHRLCQLGHLLFKEFIEQDTVFF